MEDILQPSMERIIELHDTGFITDKFLNEYLTIAGRWDEFLSMKPDYKRPLGAEGEAARKDGEIIGRIKTMREFGKSDYEIGEDLKEKYGLNDEQVNRYLKG